MKKNRIFAVLAIVIFAIFTIAGCGGGGGGGSKKVVAGDDIIITDADGDGFAVAKFDGTGSELKSDIEDDQLVWSIYDFTSKELIYTVTGWVPTAKLPVGKYRVMFTVKDVGSDEIIVTIRHTDSAPIVNAGIDIIVTDGDDDGSAVVSFDGTGSVVGGNIEDDQLVWSIYDFTTGVFQYSVTGWVPTAKLAIGKYRVVLEVTSNNGLTGTDEIIVTIKEKAAPQPNPVAPVADAGDDITVADNDNDGYMVVQFDGTGSSDPDGDLADSQLVWNISDFDTDTFMYAVEGYTPTASLEVGKYRVRLVITDDQGLVAKDIVIVTITTGSVTPPPPVVDDPEDLIFTIDGQFLVTNTPIVYAGPISNRGYDRPQDWNFAGMDKKTTRLDLSWMVKGTSIHGGMYPTDGISGDIYARVQTTDILEKDPNGNWHLVVTKNPDGTLSLGRKYTYDYSVYPVIN